MHLNGLEKSIDRSGLLERRGQSFSEFVDESQERMLQKYRREIGELLSRAGCWLPVREIERKIRQAPTLTAFLQDPFFKRERGAAFLREARNRLLDLWNYTPREEYEERSPTQQVAHLATSGASREVVNAVMVHVPDDFDFHSLPFLLTGEDV